MKDDLSVAPFAGLTAHVYTLCVLRCASHGMTVMGYSIEHVLCVIICLYACTVHLEAPPHPGGKARQSNCLNPNQCGDEVDTLAATTPTAHHRPSTSTSPKQSKIVAAHLTAHLLWWVGSLRRGVTRRRR